MSRDRERGFTLIEVMTVAFIISILAAIAMPQFKYAVISSREAVLREDLFRMRDLIDQYQADKGRYPGSLEALVEEGYMRRIPVDPISGGADWEQVPSEPDPDNPSEQPGIYDVRSIVTNPGLNGVPYNEW